MCMDGKQDGKRKPEKPRRRKIGGKLEKRIRIGGNTWVTVRRERGDDITLAVEEVQIESPTIVMEPQGDGI